MSVSLKAFKSFGLRHILSNAYQYRIFVDLPWSMGTLLTSQSSHLTMMTMGSSLWELMPTASLYEKAVSISDTFDSLYFNYLGRSSIFNTWRAYFLWENLVSLLPANPHAIVLSVWHTSLSPSSLDDSFTFMDLGILMSSLHQELDPPDPWEWSLLTYFLSCPSLIRRSISSLSC